MAISYGASPYLLGLPILSNAAAQTLQVNAAATWLGLSFNAPPGNKTLARVRVFATAVAGTLGNTTQSLDIYSDSAGAPNASLVSSTTLTSPPVAASAWNEWGGASTGLNLALTGGTQYWVVLKNNEAVPGTNFPTYGWVNGGAMPRNSGQAALAWSKKHSTNSGGAWGTAAAGVMGLRLEYTDGTFDGFPIQNISAASQGAFATSEQGSNFQLPTGANLKVAGLAVVLWSVTGTPTNGLRLGLWNGTQGSESNIAYTNTIPEALVAAAGGGWQESYFSSSQTLTGGNFYTVTMATTGADASTKRYNPIALTNDGTAAGEALMPFEGTLQQATYNGSTWSYSASAVVPILLLLDTSGEFSGTPVGQQCT